MRLYIGLDVGGTKIAAAAFTPQGEKLAQTIVPTPVAYESFLSGCAQLVDSVAQAAQASDYTIGICLPGAIDHEAGTIVAANIPYLNGQAFRDDLRRVMGREIRLANDMNCAALAEAIDGAGKGYATVLALTLSTGVGAGYVAHGHIISGPNGLTGEIGHLPLPFRDKNDAPLFPCVCHQDNCIEKAICGGGLSRLYTAMTGKQAEPPVISDLAQSEDFDALRVMDRYYESVAKAMIAAIQSFDPDIIVVSGGLSHLPHLFEEVPKRWGKYCVVQAPKTRFVPALHGPMAGLRGAAFLWREGL